MSIGCPKCGSSKANSDTDYECPSCGHKLWRSKKYFEKHLKEYEKQQAEIDKYKSDETAVEKKKLGIDDDLINQIKSGDIQLDSMRPQRLFRGEFILISHRFGHFIIKLIISFTIIAIFSITIIGSINSESQAQYWGDLIWQLYLIYVALLIFGYIFGYIYYKDKIKKYECVKESLGKNNPESFK